MEVRKGEGFRTFVGTRLGDKVAPIAVIDCRRASDCSWTQTGYDRLGLFNHLVGAGEDQRLDSEAERPGGLEVDDEFECGRLLNRKISRLSSLQGAVDIASGAAKDLEDAGAVGDEQAPRRTRGRRPAAAMSAAFDARNGSLSTMSASGLACVIAAMYYSSLMSRTCLCARLLETLD